MRATTVVLSAMLAMATGSPIHAEVYQSKDAQGNTVFSDQPSPGAQEIAVPTTNSADPVAETPRPPPQENPPVKRRKPASPDIADEKRRDDTYDDDIIYYDGDYDRDDLYERRMIERRQGEGDGAQPKRERPVKPEHHRSTPRRAGGGAGRR